MLRAFESVIEKREKRGIFAARPGITGLAQINGIDMSSPELLAETDHRPWPAVGIEQAFAVAARDFASVSIIPVFQHSASRWDATDFTWKAVGNEYGADASRRRVACVGPHGRLDNYRRTRARRRRLQRQGCVWRYGPETSDHD